MLVWTTGCKKAADQKLAVDQLNETVAGQDEWQAFKTMQEAKIAANDKIIADYKVKMTNSKGKLLKNYDKKVDVLEARNKEMKAKLAEYKDEGVESWETFKNEFNRDIVELGGALKNFTVDNTK